MSRRVLISGSVAFSSTSSALFTLRLACADRSVWRRASTRDFRSARVTDGFIAEASTAVGSTL